MADWRSTGKPKKPIDPGKIPGSNRIPTPALPADQIKFSFKYLHPNPPVSQSFPEGYWAALLGCLREHSGLNHNELVGNRNPSLRAHGIDWDDSNVPGGFDHLPSHLADVAGFQITISKDVFGRVIGFLIDGVFYVCWLDPNHETMGKKK